MNTEVNLNQDGNQSKTQINWRMPVYITIGTALVLAVLSLLYNLQGQPADEPQAPVEVVEQE